MAFVKSSVCKSWYHSSLSYNLTCSSPSEIVQYNGKLHIYKSSLLHPLGNTRQFGSFYSGFLHIKYVVFLYPCLLSGQVPEALAMAGSRLEINGLCSFESWRE